MRVLGVVLHSQDAVEAALTRASIDYCVYPKTNKPCVVVQTVEQLFLALKKDKTKDYVVLDHPTYLNGLNIRYVGSAYQGKGLHVKCPIVLPKKFPPFELDKLLRATKLTVNNVKRSLKPKTEKKAK